ARSSSRRTKARTLCPLASKNSVRLRPMPPTAPAAPVTRIGLSSLFCVVMSLTHRIGLGRRSERGAHVRFGPKSRHWRCKKSCPLYPQKRTWDVTTLDRLVDRPTYRTDDAVCGQ